MHPTDATDWQRYFNPDGTPQPLKDPADPTVWPNRWSKVNSDTSRDGAGKPMKNWWGFWFY